MNYQHNGTCIFSETLLPSRAQLIIRAQGIRKERTGVHATVNLFGKSPTAEQETLLGWSNLNIERDEDRTRLANSAYTRIGEQEGTENYPKHELKIFIDLFCLGLWDESLIDSMPVEMEGAEILQEPLYFLKPYIVHGGGTILFGPPGRGKALDDNTPIFTTEGWKTHGELTIGDYVFGPDGLQKRVLNTQRNDPARPALLVTFDNGARLVADEAHEWVISCDRYKYRKGSHRFKRPSVRKQEILETRDLLKGQRRAPAMNLTKPLQLPYRMLPVDPYVLGCWLGDGTRGTGCITSGDQDFAHFQSLGKTYNDRPGYWRIVVPGLRKSLRLAGILKGKRIPGTYFLSSFTQRLSLLQGIMDTDGSIDLSGRCELSTISRELANDYQRLISSLGIKTGCREGNAKLNGRIVSHKYRLNFYPSLELSVFTLPRKLQRQRAVIGKMTKSLYVKSIQPVSSRPMQCIEVEGGEYLAGEYLIPTHNSFVALLMTICLDAGIDKFWPVQPCVNTLIINLERSAWSIAQRVARINNILGLPQRRKINILNKKGKSLLDVADQARKIIREKGVDFLMLDSISRSGFGDLKDDRPVNAIIDCLNDLCPTWEALGHTPRASEEHVYGNIMFDAGADIIVQLMSEQKTTNLLGVSLQITKANDIAYYPADTLALEFNELGLSSIRKAGKYEFLDLLGKRRITLEDAVEEYLSEFTKATATQIANGIGKDRTKISMLLNHSAKFTMVEQIGREKFYGRSL